MCVNVRRLLSVMYVAVLQLLNVDVEYKSTIVLYACECEEAFECNYLRYM